METDVTSSQTDLRAVKTNGNYDFLNTLKAFNFQRS